VRARLAIVRGRARRRMGSALCSGVVVLREGAGRQWMLPPDR
jgi:hypothetical protein